MIKLQPAGDNAFTLDSDEPIRIAVHLVDGTGTSEWPHILASIYRQEDLESLTTSGPIGTYDGSVENFGWENDLPHGGGYYLGWIDLPPQVEPNTELQAAYDEGAAGHFVFLGHHNWFGKHRWWFAIERTDCEADYHYCAHESSSVVTTESAIRQVREELLEGFGQSGRTATLDIVLRIPAHQLQATSTWYVSVQEAGHEIMPTLRPLVHDTPTARPALDNSSHER